MPEADDYTNQILYKYLTERVLLPAGELDIVGDVKHRKCVANGNPVRVSDANRIIDKLQYEVRFDDAAVK